MGQTVSRYRNGQRRLTLRLTWESCETCIVDFQLAISFVSLNSAGTMFPCSVPSPFAIALGLGRPHFLQ